MELDQAFMHLDLGLKNARATLAKDAPKLTIVNSFEDFDYGIVEQMHSFFSDVQITIDTLPPHQAYRELLSGNADFAVLPWIKEHTGIVYEHLLKEEMLVSSADTHQLHGREYITLEELDGGMVVCNEVVFDWDSIMEICSQCGISLQMRLSSNDHQTVGRFMGLMGCNMFVPISATMEHGIDAQRRQTFPARVMPQVFYRNIYLAYQEGQRMTTAEKHFMDLLRGCYRQKEQLIQDFSRHKFRQS